MARSGVGAGVRSAGRLRSGVVGGRSPWTPKVPAAEEALVGTGRGRLSAGTSSPATLVSGAHPSSSRSSSRWQQGWRGPILLPHLICGNCDLGFLAIITADSLQPRSVPRPRHFPFRVLGPVLRLLPPGASSRKEAPSSGWRLGGPRLALGESHSFPPDPPEGFALGLRASLLKGESGVRPATLSGNDNRDFEITATMKVPCGLRSIVCTRTFCKVLMFSDCIFPISVRFLLVCLFDFYRNRRSSELPRQLSLGDPG